MQEGKSENNDKEFEITEALDQSEMNQESFVSDVLPDNDTAPILNDTMDFPAENETISIFNDTMDFPEGNETVQMSNDTTDISDDNETMPITIDNSTFLII